MRQKDFPPKSARTSLNIPAWKKNRYALGEVLDELQPDRFNKICTRLSEKGYKTECHRILNESSEIAAFVAAGVGVFLML
jgi:hypothetical protein